MKQGSVEPRLYRLGKTSNLDGVIMRLGFVKNTGGSAFLVAMLVVAPQVWAETFTAKVVGGV